MSLRREGKIVVGGAEDPHEPTEKEAQKELKRITERPGVIYNLSNLSAYEREAA